MKLVEARVPTFQRPAMLRRALQSLRKQTWANWVALVFDDSPSREGAEIVQSFGDERIIYRANRDRLGASGNLDQAFCRSALLKGEYAFVLEDDNGLLPEFIEDNVNLMERSQSTILLRNQKIYDQRGIEWIPTAETTKGSLCNATGFYPPIHFRAGILLSDCIANGGLFWEPAKTQSELQVGSSVADSGVQEYCRTAQVCEPVFAAVEPLGIWTRSEAREKSGTEHRRFNRSLQALRRWLLQQDKATLIEAAINLAQRINLEPRLAENLAHSGYTFSGVPFLAKHYLKGLALRALTPNPIKAYFLRQSA